MVATPILLLRHAQSTWNAQRRWQGWADPPLSPEGEEAALAAGRLPLFDAIRVVVASDLARARRTAELLGTGHSWGPVTAFRGLRERGAGKFTGLTRGEIERSWPGVLEATPAVAIVGGEAIPALLARAVATLQRVAEVGDGRPVLAVTHGALIRAIEHHAGGDPAHVANLAGRWVHVHAGCIALGADARHFAPLPRAEAGQARSEAEQAS